MPIRDTLTPPGYAYGSIRIQEAPPDAHVFADGTDAGVVGALDGRRLNLVAGVHRIEINKPGLQPAAVDVNVRPGQTITYRAAMQPTE